MVKDFKLLDKIHLQKYIYMISLFVSQKISASDFEIFFLQIRNEDNYWLSNSFDKKIGKLLDTFFLDISDYTPDDLYDPNDPNDINEVELRKRAKDILEVFHRIV